MSSKRARISGLQYICCLLFHFVVRCALSVDESIQERMAIQHSLKLLPPNLGLFYTQLWRAIALSYWEGNNYRAYRVRYISEQTNSNPQ